MTEHGIGSYEELLDRCEAATVSVARLKANLRDAGAKIDELALKMKHVGTYRQLKPIYDRYKASRDKEKFLRGHESEIILLKPPPESASGWVRSRCLPRSGCRLKWTSSTQRGPR